MAYSRRSLIASIVVFFCFGCVSFAATPNITRGISLSAVWLRGQDVPLSVHLDLGGEKPQLIDVGASSRGRPFNLPKAIPANTKVAIWVAPAAGMPLVNVGQLTWPAGLADRGLLLIAATDGGRKMAGMVIRDDVDFFPVNSWRIVNFTQDKIFARVDGRVETVEPGIGALRPYPVVNPQDKSAAMPRIPLVFGTQERIFFNGRIDARPRSRTLVLLSRKPGGDSRVAEVQYITDTISEPAAPSAPRQGG